MDIGALQGNLTNITFSDILSEDLTNVDRNFVKLFRLSQLMLEYVLFTQEQLAQGRDGTEAQLRRAYEVRIGSVCDCLRLGLFAHDCLHAL